MAKDIDPKLQLISDYLKINENETFVIPEYQRGYSWRNDDQCEKLWQDIEAFIDTYSTDPYFFGTIIVDCSETNNSYSLIDGQQRTTTFLLLLKALLLKIQETLKTLKHDEETEALEESLKDNRNKIIDILCKTDGAERRYELLKNWNLVKKIILIENKSINELYKNELQIIIAAKDYETAENNCYKIPRKQKDNKYTNYFRNFKYFYDKLSQYSETRLNTFAKTFLGKCQIIEIKSWQIEQAITMFNSLNSTGMPLSDADIISAQMYSHSGKSKKDFNKKWEEITELASELNSQKITTIDSILQQYMYINRAMTKEYIEKGYVDVTTPGLRKYYLNIHKELLTGPMELCKHFYKIVQIWDNIKDYPIIKLLLKFNENAKLYLISYLFRFSPAKITEETITAITECLLRLFTILELVDAGYSSKNFKTFLFGENIKLVDKKCSLSSIIEDFNNHIANTWSEDYLRQSIIDYDKNVLVFLNEYLFDKKNFNFFESVNIEHIMPSSGHDLDAIREDAGISSQAEFNSLVNKLGNKILLEENINKSIGKKWFQTKKQKSIKEKSGYKDSKYNIAKSLINYPSNLWTKDDINNATNKVADRIIKFIFSK